LERKEHGRPLREVKKDGEVLYIWRIAGISGNSLESLEVKKSDNGRTTAVLKVPV
jgi:hypothetical protein